jgi:uncharacterized membrane protein YeaQ/YmgE (transglycosylase-associated protein family)
VRADDLTNAGEKIGHLELMRLDYSAHQREKAKEDVVVLHIIWMIVLGLIVGWIARWIVPGRNKMGLVATAVLGVIGAYVGGTLGSVVFPPHQFTITPPIKHSFLGALVGAVILLWIYRLITARTSRR